MQTLLHFDVNDLGLGDSSPLKEKNMKIGDRIEVDGKLVEITNIQGKNFAYKPVVAGKEVIKEDAPRKRAKKEA